MATALRGITFHKDRVIIVKETGRMLAHCELQLVVFWQMVHNHVRGLGTTVLPGDTVTLVTNPAPPLHLHGCLC